jgi:G3E family GTPase
MRGEMLQAVARVLALAPSRIVLETTGIADPAPIVHGLWSDPSLGDQLALAGVVAVADASRIDELLDSQPEVRRQLEFADRVVLSKVDLVPERVPTARERLAEAAPGCDVRDAVHGAVDRAWLLAERSLRGMRTAGDARTWLHHGKAAAAVRTHAVQVAAPARVELVQLWLRLVTQLDGHRLVRIKGLVECAATGEVFAVQSAGHAVSPPRRLAQRPDGVRGVRLVIIVRGMPAAAMPHAIDALHAAAAATPAGPAQVRER